MQKLRQKITSWSVGVYKEVTSTLTKSEVEIVLHDIDATKNVIWNLHMDDLQRTHGYVMIPRLDILFKINIDLFFYNNTSRGNVCTREGCTDPM